MASSTLTAPPSALSCMLSMIGLSVVLDVWVLVEIYSINSNIDLDCKSSLSHGSILIGNQPVPFGQ